MKFGIAYMHPSYLGNAFNQHVYDERNVCREAGIEPGLLYETREAAQADADKLMPAYWRVFERDLKTRGYYPPGHNGYEFLVFETTPSDVAEFEWRKRYPWIDPDTVETEKIDRFMLVKEGASHKSMAFYTISHSNDIEKIDDHSWQIYRASLTGVVDGRRYFWGMFVEGLGMFHMMVAEENMRDLTSVEKRAWSKRGLAMVGSHSGEHSYSFNLPEIQ